LLLQVDPPVARLLTPTRPARSANAPYPTTETPATAAGVSKILTIRLWT
jgi:hypothetical protein